MMTAFAMIATAAAQRLPSQPRADVIFLNANIYTGVETSSFHAIQRAEAMAVHDGRVEAVGRNDEIVKLKGPSTEVIDLGGHFVMPGFNDAHVHLANAGFQRLTVDLVGSEIADRVSRSNSGARSKRRAQRVDSGRGMGPDSVAGERTPEPLGH